MMIFRHYKESQSETEVRKLLAMALSKIILFQFLILAAAHLMLAENDDSGLFGFPSSSRRGDHHHGHGGGGGGGFDPEMPANQSTGDPDDQSRFFFSSLFSSLTTCNYTSQAGRSCLGCNTALTCLNNNVGIVRNCRGFFRYCNNGACSLFPGSACNSTNSTTG